MKKVLVMGMTDNPGGVESVIMNYYRNLDPEKIHFDFLSNYNPIVYDNEILERGSKIFYVTPRSKNPKKFKDELNDFFKQYAKEYDAIWVNLCSLVNIDYLKYAQKYGIPKRIIHCHNADNDAGILKKLIHNYNKKILPKYANEFWSCDKEAAPWFYSPEIIDSEHFLIIENAIDLKKYVFNPIKREQIRKQLGIENNFVIGHIGRFHFQKNHKFILQIFAQILEERNDAVLLLVGDGDLREEIINYAQSLGVNESIIYTGAVLNAQDYYNAMDIFVFPSIFEGLGLVGVEAQANGLPTIIADTIPAKVLVNDNSAILPIEDPILWKNKVLELSSFPREDQTKLKKSFFNLDHQLKNFEEAINK